MEIMTSYADLVRKIKILETQSELIDAEMDYWFGKLAFSGTGSAKFGMLAAVDNTEEIHIRKYRTEKMLEFYKEIEKEMKENIDALEGLPYKIARLRFIDGMNYQEVAEELGLTYGYVRQVASKSNKERTALFEKA